MKKRIRYMLLIIGIMLIVTGCKDMTQVEDRNFILAMGVNKKVGNGEKYEITFVLPDYKELTGKGKSKENGNKISIYGKSLNEIEEKFRRESSKRIDYNHLKVIILDEDISKDKKMLGEFLENAENNYEIGRNTLIFLSKESPKKVLEEDKTDGLDVGTYLEEMQENNRNQDEKRVVTLGNLITAWNNKDETIIVPVIEEKEEKLIRSGGAFYSCKGLRGIIDETDLAYINIAKGNSSRLKNMKRKVSIVMRDNKIYADIKIYDTTTSLFTQNPIYEENLNAEIQKYIKKNEIDFLNLYRMTSWKNKKIWKKYQGKEEKFIKDIIIKCNVIAI